MEKEIEKSLESGSELQEGKDSVGPCQGELSQQVRDQNSIPRGQGQLLEGGLTHRGFPRCHRKMVSDGKSQPSKR